MMVILRTLVFTACAWPCTTMFMRACDRRLILARFDTTTNVRTATRIRIRPVARISRRRPTFQVEDRLDALARDLRTGTPPRDAITSFFTTAWPEVDVKLDDSIGLGEALGSCATSAPERIGDVIRLVAAAHVAGTVSVAGIDHAAVLLRAHTRSQEEARTAAAQARLSVRVLTLLPLGVLIFLVLQKGTGPMVGSPTVMFITTIGLVLNLIGWRWACALSSRAATGAPDPSAPLVASFAVSLRAGLEPAAACLRWHDINDVGRAVADRIEAHLPLRDALTPLESCSSRGSLMATTIVDSVASGLPLTAVASRILDGLHDDERRATETRVRELPVRLMAPIVLCTLPSFVLLGVVPMVVTAFPHGIAGRFA